MHLGGLILVVRLHQRAHALRVQVGIPHLFQHLSEVVLIDLDFDAHEFAPVGTRPSRASFSIMAPSVKGLITYSWAPAASARTIWLCSLSVVTMTSVISRRRGSARTLVKNSSPFMLGMFHSMRASSGTSLISASRSSA